MRGGVEQTLTIGGNRLAYTSYGDGPRVTVLVHGLLLSQRMHEQLAEALAERGNRVITLDLLGHGRSDRPADMWRYSMTAFGEQVIALLDHLEAARRTAGAHARVQLQPHPRVRRDGPRVA